MRHALVALSAALAMCLAAPPAAAFDEGERAAIREEIRAYLLENPEILREMIGLLEAQEAGAQADADRAAITANDERIFDDGFSFVGGNPEGDTTLVEFIDYQCGFCRRAHPEVQALVDGDGDLRLVTKELPILGPGSELAARAAVATLIAEGSEAYARLNNALLSLEGPVTDASLDAALRDAGLEAAAIRAGMEDDEVTRRLAETRALAQSLGISGTPTFVIGDRLVRGYLPLADMEALIEAARRDG
jgi:protein-disulfide isomerase